MGRSPNGSPWRPQPQRAADAASTCRCDYGSVLVRVTASVRLTYRLGWPEARQFWLDDTQVMAMRGMSNPEMRARILFRSDGWPASTPKVTWRLSMFPPTLAASSVG